MLEHGRVVEAGSFDELMHKGGPFAELAKAQYLSAEPPAPLPSGPDEIRAAE